MNHILTKDDQIIHLAVYDRTRIAVVTSTGSCYIFIQSQMTFEMKLDNFQVIKMIWLGSDCLILLDQHGRKQTIIDSRVVNVSATSLKDPSLVKAAHSFKSKLYILYADNNLEICSFVPSMLISLTTVCLKLSGSVIDFALSDGVFCFEPVDLDEIIVTVFTDSVFFQQFRVANVNENRGVSLFSWKKYEIEPAFSFNDPGRVARSVSFNDDDGGAAASVVVADNYGRVAVIDLKSGVIRKLWKGYRGASVGFVGKKVAILSSSNTLEVKNEDGKIEETALDKTGVYTLIGGLVLKDDKQIWEIKN